jgi:hypothetical protein
MSNPSSQIAGSVSIKRKAMRFKRRAKARLFKRRARRFFVGLWSQTKPALVDAWAPLANAWDWGMDRWRALENALPTRPVEDGSVHVALPVRTSLILAVGSLIFSMLLYALLMHHFQSRLQIALETTPVIRDILDPSIGIPLRPIPGFSVSREWEPGGEAPMPQFDDHYRVTAAQWLEVLKRLGLVDADSGISQYLGEVTNEDYRPTQTLIARLQDVTQGQSLGGIAPLPLLTGLATRLNNAGAASGAKNGDASVCWSAALSQVMAGFPGRWRVLADAVRASSDSKMEPAASASCAWNAVGDFSKQPSFLRYIIFFYNDVPNEATIARTLLEATGALGASHDKADLPDSGAPIDHLNVLRRSDQAAPKPDADAAIQVKTTALAEQFSRQLLGAMMTTSDVRGPKLWLDALVGLPQAVLNWFFFMLLAFVIGRMMLLGRMRREIVVVTSWLAENKSLLEEASATKRAKNAIEMAANLVNLQDPSQRTAQVSALASFRDWIRRALADFFDKAKPASFRDRMKRASVSFFERRKPDWTDVRQHSLIALMAEKALRRLIVGESQPELFREFCAARRAMVDESAWFLRYMSRALPALGFVGTILGILFALNGADGIVRASTQAERISAMAAVTGPLAFAFSHTFIALLAGLITGFWIDRETAQERLSLLAYEESLIEKIDLAERDASA